MNKYGVSLNFTIKSDLSLEELKNLTVGNLVFLAGDFNIEKSFEQLDD